MANPEPSKLMEPNEQDEQEKTPKSPSTISLRLTKFADVRYEDQFIDQTEVLEVMMSNKELVQFVGAPQKYGKSIKADMTILFFGIPRDKNGKPMFFENPRDSPNYKLFEDTKIAENESFVKKHFGQYPVLYVDFSDNGVFSSVESMDHARGKVKKIISATYLRHEYLYESEKLTKSQRSICCEWCDEKECCSKRPEDVESSLSDLVRYLLKHHEKPVFLIMDEVDAPCVQALFSNDAVTRNLYEKIQSLMISMLNLEMINNYNGYTLIGRPPLSIFNPSSCLLAAYGDQAQRNPTYVDPDYLAIFITALLHDEEILWIFEHLFLNREVEYRNRPITKKEILRLKEMIDKFNAKDEVIPSTSSTAKFCVSKVHVVQSDITRILMMFLAELGCFKYVPASSIGWLRVKLPNSSVREYFEREFTEHYDNGQNTFVRIQIQAAVQIQSLIALAVLERDDENEKLIQECLSKFAQLFRQLLIANFVVTEKSFNEANVVNLFDGVFKKIPKAVINLEFSMLNKKSRRRFIDIWVLVGNKVGKTEWKDEKILIVTEVKVSNENNTNSAFTALNQIFNRGYMHGAEAKAKYALALGLYAAEPTETEDTYSCECGFLGGLSKSVSKKYKPASAIYVQSQDI